MDAAWYETTRSEVVYEGFSTVRVDQVRMPSGEEFGREVVEHTSAVAIVPVMDDGSVLLLRQYRHPVGGYVLEIPAGLLDVDGEAPREAALRELAEETGHTADRIDELTRFQNSSGWTDESTTVFLAGGLREAPAPDGFEAEAEEADMEIVRLPLDDLLHEVHSGTITDAKTIIGLLMAAARLD